MLSPDLLGILMRGIQARHHDWGMAPDAASPEEAFSALIDEAADARPAGARLASLAGEESPLDEAPAEEAAVPDALAAVAPEGRRESLAEGDATTGAAGRRSGETMPVTAGQDTGTPRAAAEAEVAPGRAPREGGSNVDGPPAPSPNAGAAPAAPSGQIVAATAEGLVGWRLGGEGAAAVAGAAAAAPAAPATAASPPSVAGQVAVAIAGADGERVEIRLDPPELGRVQIAIRVIDGALTAVVLAERPEVADMLRRHASDLERDLAAAGYEDVSLDFGEGHDEAPDERAAPPAAAATAKGERLPLEFLPAARLADGRLDIRL